jgi:altronate hydrolase
MAEDMDLNCGEILDGATSLEDMGVQIYQRILDTASGRATSSGEFGYGEDEFAPWQFGATL